ncbi:hypothetical protein C2U54_20610 [Leclercia sp. LSNIH1]|nr:hypothetical protein C2U54_20610 [Leclercia sp. LSNIH1]POV36561.1 hypothetical protein C3388_04630 [Leclercia sp. LSNIH5]POW68495.1 hypothetical protein C3389_01815 [Leclercia sp. LSNIH2]
MSSRPYGTRTYAFLRFNNLNLTSKSTLVLKRILTRILTILRYPYCKTPICSIYPQKAVDKRGIFSFSRTGKNPHESESAGDKARRYHRAYQSGQNPSSSRLGSRRTE